MEQKIYGYVRVSTKDQNEDRQIEAMLQSGIPKERIFIDKQRWYTPRNILQFH